jgi:hypothetical protein
MLTPHPGKWERVLESECMLDTEEIAVHASLIYNQSTKKWKVLYFYAGQQSGVIKSRIWNPENNEITEQEIPDWPGTGNPLPRQEPVVLMIHC